MRACGSRYARLVFERCHGNKREACRVLGISYHTLNAYLRYPFAEPPSTDEMDQEWEVSPAEATAIAAEP
jgi:hypothetical protein